MSAGMRFSTSRGTNGSRRKAFAAITLALGLARPAPAAIGASVGIVSDQLLRGRSLSAGRPVGSLDLAYDDARGPYAGVSVSGVLLRHEGARLFGVQEYAGYARRLQPGLTLDLGATNSDYSDYGSAGRHTNYTEFSAGLIGRHLSGRISFSPDYFAAGADTLYGELAGTIGRAEGWQLLLHAGLLRWLNDRRPAGAPVNHYDWSAGVARRFGPVSGRVMWAAGGPNRDYYQGRARGHGALVAGVSLAF